MTGNWVFGAIAVLTLLHGIVLLYAYRRGQVPGSDGEADASELPHPARAIALAEGGASCFCDALCRYGCIHRERSLHRRSFGVSHS